MTSFPIFFPAPRTDYDLSAARHYEPSLVEKQIEAMMAAQSTPNPYLLRNWRPVWRSPPSEWAYWYAIGDEMI